MNNKKNIQFILITLIIAIVLSFLIEIVYFNRSVFRINETYSPEIVETKDIIKKDNKLVTNSKDSYIIVKVKNNYVNKLQFNYKANKNIAWQIKYLVNNEEISIDNISSLFINKASRQIMLNTDYLTIQFNNKNITINNIKINNSIYINWGRLIFLIILLTLIPLLIKFRKQLSNNLDKTFILIALISGFLYILITPKTVYNSWDDQIHIKNAQVFTDSQKGEYSEGFQLLTAHDVMDDKKIKSTEEQLELYKAINKFDNNTSDMIIQVNNYSPKYNKLIYLPFKVGFVISDILHLNLITAIVIAKFLNLLAYTLIIAFAIKISSPSIKKLLFVIGLLISNIFLASQFSYDPTITASLLLAVALFIKMLEENEINIKYLIAFIIAIIWASLPKAVYCLFGLLVLAIPNNKFKNKNQAIKLKMVVIAIVLLLISNYVLPALLGGVSGDSRGGNTSVSGQLSFMLHNPISYAIILLKFIFIRGPELLIGNSALAGTGYILIDQNQIKNNLYILSIIYLLYIAFTNHINDKIINNKIKMSFALLISASLVLIPTALYIVFTEVGNMTIEGVQARYFISLLLPLTIIMSQKSKSNKKEKIVEYIPIISFAILMIGLFFILKESFGI